MGNASMTFHIFPCNIWSFTICNVIGPTVCSVINYRLKNQRGGMWCNFMKTSNMQMFAFIFLQDSSFCLHQESYINFENFIYRLHGKLHIMNSHNSGNFSHLHLHLHNSYYTSVIWTKSNWICSWSNNTIQYKNLIAQYSLVIVQQLCTVYNMSITDITNYCA